MKQRWIFGILLLIAAAFFTTGLRAQIYDQTAVSVIKNCDPKSDIFRRMEFSTHSIKQLLRLCEETQMKAGEVLALLYSDTDGDFRRFPDNITADDILDRKQYFYRKDRLAYEKLAVLYGMIWNDLESFPVSSDAESVYENTWMFERTYGGVRGHEGTDLVPERNIQGHYKVLSMTDGTVEQVGWLPQGGYRIGIRSPSGSYFYYAHLDSYAKEYQPGMEVQSGDVLGTMGDTGYGEEGSSGKFAVHLHLGLYIKTAEQPELSVNPYWILRYLEAKSVS